MGKCASLGIGNDARLTFRDVLTLPVFNDATLYFVIPVRKILIQTFSDKSFIWMRGRILIEIRILPFYYVVGATCSNVLLGALYGTEFSVHFHLVNPYRLESVSILV